METKNVRTAQRCLGASKKPTGCLLAVLLMLAVSACLSGCSRKSDKRMYYYEHNLSERVGYYAPDEGKYLYDRETGRKLLKNIDWLYLSSDEDEPLAVFSKGGKRGYVDIHTGKVVVKPAYKHAWVFAKGLAAVVQDSVVKFIDRKGEVVIDKDFSYVEGFDYYFRGETCAMTGPDKKRGLIDRLGAWRLEPVYDAIYRTDSALWHLAKDEREGVANDSGRVVLPAVYRDVYVTEDVGIRAANSDHTIQVYDYQGHLLEGFAYDDIKHLYYPTATRMTDADGDVTEQEEAEANGMKYCVHDGFCGLMSLDGQRLTPPVYTNIKAIGPNRFRADMTYGASVLLDGRGNVVR